MKPLVLLGISIYLTCFAFAARAADQPVAGWRQAKWGMTPAEVEAAFNGDAVKSRVGQFSKTNILLTIPQVEIEGEKFVATFHFNGGKLTNVVLQLSEGSDSLYQNIFQRLVEKYGEPDFKDKSQTKTSVGTDVTEKRAWNRGKTRIEWKFLTIAGGGVKLWTLSYSQLQSDPSL